MGSEREGSLNLFGGVAGSAWLDTRWNAKKKRKFKSMAKRGYEAWVIFAARNFAIAGCDTGLDRHIMFQNRQCT